jgi:hypothetical protein
MSHVEGAHLDGQPVTSAENIAPLGLGPQESTSREPVHDYGSASIKILDDTEALERFPWLEAEGIAAQYSQPLDFVKRLLETCRLSGWPVEHAIKRYFEGDTSVPVPLEVRPVHRDVVKRYFSRAL